MSLVAGSETSLWGRIATIGMRTVLLRYSRGEKWRLAVMFHEARMLILLPPKENSIDQPSLYVKGRLRQD